jgi:hypothetical protein
MFVAGDLETVLLVSPPQRDSFGDPIDGPDSSVEIPGCLFAPGDGSENGSRFGQGRVGDNQVETNAVLFAPAGTQVSPADRIVVRGETFEVLGQSLQWGGAGVEIGLHRVTG